MKPPGAGLPQLLLSAGPDEFMALRAALLRLHREQPELFATLLAPDSKSRRIDKLPPEQSWPLLRFGLVERDASGSALWGRHRVRVVGDRFYVMELGGLTEYFQDVWPETDALLAVLDRMPPGRLLDLGCGTGIVAIEGARRGHQVVATDLYESALQLSQFNARLNGVAKSIEFRIGHQLDPVRGERFDLILTAPHYTRVADQLRLEVLRAAPAHLYPLGTLVVATMFEWQGAQPPMIDEILTPHCATGMSILVEPLPTPYKREWFTVRRLSAELRDTPTGDALVSRHRFLVTMVAPPTSMPAPMGELRFSPPLDSESMFQPYVPLSRLANSARRRSVSAQVMPDSAVIATRDDVETLRRLLVSLDRGVASFGVGGPYQLHDACRYGARRCVTPQGFDGAAGAILDHGGTVRPCSHGQPVGSKEDSTAQIISRLGQAATAMRQRRGCASCPIEPHCAQCLFPFPLSDDEYCQLMRSAPLAVPQMPRLAASLPRLLAWVSSIPVSGELRVKVRRSSELVAARGRPAPSSRPLASENDRRLAAQLAALSDAWRRHQVWLAGLGRTHFALLLALGNSLPIVPISPLAAEIAELVSDGADVSEIRDYLRMHHVSSQQADQALALLARCLPLD